MKGVFSLSTQKTAEATEKYALTQAEHLQEGRMQDCIGDLCLYCKGPHKAGDKKILGEYKMEARIQNKIILDICDAYTTKETLGYRRRYPMC